MQNYLKHLDSSTTNDYSLWKATKKLKQPKIAFHPIRREDKSWAKNCIEKTDDTFGAHLLRIFTPYSYEGTSGYMNEILDTLEIPITPDEPIKKFNRLEVATAIKNLDKKGFSTMIL